MLSELSCMIKVGLGTDKGYFFFSRSPEVNEKISEIYDSIRVIHFIKEPSI